MLIVTYQIIFVNNLGLIQREVLSPILFDVFVNDFKVTFI